MCITMPNGKTTTQILLKDVLYVPKMGVTLVSIGKIDTAGYTALFHKNQLQIFFVTKGRKMLAQIPMKNGLYCVKHDRDVDIAAVVTPVVVTIEKLHCLMGHIALEAAKALVNKGLVEGLNWINPARCQMYAAPANMEKLIGKWLERNAKLLEWDELEMRFIPMFGDCHLSRLSVDENTTPPILMITPGT